MSSPQEKIQLAIAYALENKPQVGGFPFLAECLRQAGIERNIWTLPSAQSVYILKEHAVIHQGAPLITGMIEVPSFNEEALVTALRKDQSGLSTFPEFLTSAWEAGVTTYEVDFLLRTVSYYGVRGEKYVEAYSLTEVTGLVL